MTATAGLAAVSKLCDRLGVIGALDAAVGPIKHRGFGAGEQLTGIAAAQLAGDDFLTGLDGQRADTAGQQITPVPDLASTLRPGSASDRRDLWFRRRVAAGLAPKSRSTLAL